MPDEEMGSRSLPQPPDVATNIVVITVAGLLVFVTLTMAGLLFYIRAAAPDALIQEIERPFPQPALQLTPQADLKEFERTQRLALSSYGWVDQAKGLARIPIELAMQLIAARGDHAFDPIAPPSSATSPENVTGGQR